MDDSGYFSVQVISSALKVLFLELVPYTSTEPTALMAQNNPSQMKAYICNYKGHWFTIRKLGNQWFNLNSMLSGPQLISDTYLAMYLAQLIQEGYSIFIVIGTFPTCKAEEVLLENPIVTNAKSTNEHSSKFPSTGYRLSRKSEDDANILQSLQYVMVSPYLDNQLDVEIISESQRQSRQRIIPIRVEGRDQVHTIVDDEENDDFQKALSLSLEDYEKEEQEKVLKLKLDNHSTSTNSSEPMNSVDNEEDDDLRRALQLSLECVSSPQTPDSEDVRWHRLAYLRMHSRGPQTENSTKLNT
ncbi:PREDICTED: ataxin-3-like isoform X2 [Ceratosolen solmsi marchali]|nr:PREDICTED: ataxin-3-like isoform X2 [Ceratosolen solmsi marchali]